MKHHATVIHHAFGTGAASVERIAHGMRTGAIKTIPRAAQRRQPLTSDPYLLGDGIPVLRLVGSRHERSVPEPVPFVAAPLPARQRDDIDERSDVDPVWRRRAWIGLTLWCVGCVVGFAYYLFA
jgi:hypothetical protein